MDGIVPNYIKTNIQTYILPVGTECSYKTNPQRLCYDWFKKKACKYMS